MATPTYLSRLATITGSHPLGSLADGFTPETVTWTLNAQQEVEFSFPKNLLTPADIDVLVTGGSLLELQVRDSANDIDLFWGPVTYMNGAGSDGAVHGKAEGVDWYLFRRFLDGIVTEYMTNRDFESDFTDWSDWNGDPPGTSSSATHFSIDTDRVFTGDKSAKLGSLGGGEFVADHFIQHDFVDIVAGSIGLLVVLSGWFYIDPATTYSPAVDGRGLYLEWRDTSNVFIGNDWYVLDGATPTGTWVKAQVFHQIPPSTTHRLFARAYAGNAGTVWWDDLKLVDFDSIGFVDLTASLTTPADIGDLVCHVVDRLQASGIGKSDVAIATSPTSIGKTVFKTWQYSDHVQFDQALNEFVQRDDGIDYEVIADQTAATRTFVNYAGKRGTDRTGAFTLQFDVNGQRNCSDYRFTKDGANCITRQTVLGEDSGPDREESEIADASNVDGLILQDVRQAPQDTLVRSLERLAQARLNLFSAPPLAIEMDLVNNMPVFLGTVRPGDLVQVDILDGWIVVSAPMRVHQMRLDCRTNVLTFTLVAEGLS